MTTLFVSQLLTAQGWRTSARVSIAHGRIAALQFGVAPEPGDERHAVLVPTLDNLHSHAFQRGMAGLAETRGTSTDDFWTWRETMYRFASRTSPEQLEAIATQAYVEMLEAGYGRVGEFHYLHRDVDGRAYGDVGEMSARIAAAAEHSGIALTLLPVFYAHASFGGVAPRANQARFLNDVDGYARLLERCRAIVAALPEGRVGVAPHSLRAVTPGELQHVVALAGDAPIHIHIAEQTHEVDDCVAWSGARPVRWLLDHAPVDSRWCLVHATHVDADELTGLVASRSTVGLCPITEANLGDGIFPAAELDAGGGAFGIGTDSNVAIDLAGELSLLEYSQRLSRRVRNVLVHSGRSTGRALFERALFGGSRALGKASLGIAVGARADFVSLDASRPSLLSRSGDALLDSWIFASPRGAVDCVWVGGRQVVTNGRHVHAEVARSRFAKAMEELCA
ncbi:formimidoylglutamate deiminase [bacterium]|nr:MAG: formimidoylglutamate deiminase [bacterium]